MKKHKSVATSRGIGTTLVVRHCQSQQFYTGKQQTNKQQHPSCGDKLVYSLHHSPDGVSDTLSADASSAKLTQLYAT